MVFDEEAHTNERVIESAKRDAQDYRSYHKHIYGGVVRRPLRSSKCWVPPPEGCTKINADASTSDEGWVDLGVVARDHGGRVLFVVCRRVRAWWPVDVAEGKALLLALKLSRAHEMRNVIMETDCQSLDTKLSKGAIFNSDLDNVLEDILVSSKSFDSIIWSHVLRDSNSVVHHLARLVPFGGGTTRWEHNCPRRLPCMY